MIRGQQRALAALNVLGGVAVLTSYVYAFSYPGEIRAGLWGGVPESLRSFYTVNMLLAALGYFPFTWLYVWKVTPEEVGTATRVPYALLFALYALVLVPSALWLPMTARMIEAPGWGLWWGIRAVLALVALGSTGLLLLSWRYAHARPGTASRLAALGSIPFFTQTAILDALIWPAYYPS